MHSGFHILWLWAYTSVTDLKLSSCWHDDRREWVTSCASVAVLCVGPPSALDHLQSDILKGRSAHVIVLHKSLWWLFSAFRSLFLFAYSVRSDFFVCFTFFFFFKQSLKGPPYIINLPFLLYLARQTGPSGLARGSFRSLPGHLTTLASQANDPFVIPTAFPWWHMPHLVLLCGVCVL